MMKKITIKGKDIYIVRSHNQVLEAWEQCHSKNVFSFDYHTDTKEAFKTYANGRAKSEIKCGHSYNIKAREEELKKQKIENYINKRITINQINYNLRHDEHIDFAVSTNIIDTAFILAKNSNISNSNPNVHIVNGPTKYKNHKIIEYSPLCTPDCIKENHDKSCKKNRADSSIKDSVLNDALYHATLFNKLFFSNFILDIDCDYFNTEASLYPQNYTIFKRLIRDSKIITVALEPECVKICRHEDSSLTSETILNRLISLFESI